MKTGQPTGNQIAFFILAAWLLMVPLAMFIEKHLALDKAASVVFNRYFNVVLVGCALLAIPALRRACKEALARPIGASGRGEVTIVSLLAPLHGFAYAGLLVLWIWLNDGPLGLMRFSDGLGSGDAAMAESLKATPLVAYLLVAVLIGPIVEELLFRAFLYRAWERRFGWFRATLFSSALFAMLHPAYPIASFMSAVIFVCVYRRTGSLRSCIIVHAAGNLLAWYPMLGRVMFLRDLESPGNIEAWWFQVSCTLLAAILLPVYVWMSRDNHEDYATFEDDHVALPR